MLPRFKKKQKIFIIINKKSPEAKIRAKNHILGFSFINQRLILPFLTLPSKNN